MLREISLVTTVCKNQLNLLAIVTHFTHSLIFWRLRVLFPKCQNRRVLIWKPWTSPPYLSLFLFNFFSISDISLLVSWFHGWRRKNKSITLPSFLPPNTCGMERNVWTLSLMETAYKKYFWFSITPFNSLPVEVLPAQGLAFLTWPSGT